MPLPEAMSLAELIRPEQRYHRSTNLERDVEALERQGFGTHLVRTAGLNQVNFGAVASVNDVLQSCFVISGGARAVA